MERPVLSLDDPDATDARLTGAKAANLARARQAGLPALPGAVLTTSWVPTDVDAAHAVWQSLTSPQSRPLVVRSSSTGEDGASSSMAGVFESVLDVGDESTYLVAVDAVLASARRAQRAGLVDAPMAVLVQPLLRPRWGGVLFGADPVTGRRDRLVVAAVPGGPAELVAGEVEGWTGVLDRRGRLVEERGASVGAAPDARPTAGDLRRLAKLARAASRVFGGPQDLEWAIDDEGRVVLLQTRPITTLAPVSGPVFGPGPVAETFPEPLAALEQDLWLDPMRDGLREALRLTGAVPAHVLERSPVVLAVDGLAAADLGVLGLVTGERRGVLHVLDPRPPARRLRASWRVGRLRAALPELAADLVHRVDAELLAVPELTELANHELLAVLRNGRRTLVSLHGHEALAGLLIPDADGASVTGASLALSVLAQASSEGVPFDELVEREPVVLAVIPPRIGPPPDLGSCGDPAVGGALDADTAGAPDPAAIAREALRLRIRWTQELMARATWRLGQRLVDVEVLPSEHAVRLLSLDELAEAVRRRRAPQDLGVRREPSGRPLPARFRIDEAGVAVGLPADEPARRRTLRAVLSPRGVSTAPAAIGAGGGVGTGPVHVGGAGAPAGSVAVVSHLDPRLAPIVPRLAGLVAETGNALSHLAILAREHRVPVVVGFAGATTRFRDGELVRVDGTAGTVEPAAPVLADVLGGDNR